MFINALLKFIRPVEKRIFNINDPFGMKMLRLRFSYHHKLKLRHSLNSNQVFLTNDLGNVRFPFLTVNNNNVIIV